MIGVLVSVKISVYILCHAAFLFKKFLDAEIIDLLTKADFLPLAHGVVSVIFGPHVVMCMHVSDLSALLAGV